MQHNTEGPPNDGAPHPADEGNAGGNAERRGLVHVTQQPSAISKTNETSASMLASRARAEIQVRTEQALRFPRDEENARKRLLKACESVAFADAAIYAKPMGPGKEITGLSIRFAEEAARCWSNLDVSVIVISEDDDRRVLEAVSVDLETNHIERAQFIVPKFVERSSVKQGDEVIGSRQNSRGIAVYKIRASDDAMFTAHQAAASKARREAILIQIPFWIKEEAEERLNRTLDTLGGKPEAFLAGLLKSFERVGVTQTQIETIAGKTATMLTLPELRRLKKLQNAIESGETTWADVVANAKKTDETPSGAASGGDAQPTKGAAAALRKKAAPASTEPKPESKTEAKPDESAPAKCPECGADAPHHMRTCSQFEEE
jgi:hypothetical protein